MEGDYHKMRTARFCRATDPSPSTPRADKIGRGGDEGSLALMSLTCIVASGCFLSRGRSPRQACLGPR